MIFFTTAICYDLFLFLPPPFDCCAFILPQLFAMNCYCSYLIVVLSFYHSYFLWLLPQLFAGPFCHGYFLGLLTTAICWAFWPQLFAMTFYYSYLIAVPWFYQLFAMPFYHTYFCAFILPQLFAVTVYHSYLIVVPSFYHSHLLWRFTTAIGLLCLHFTTAIYYDIFATVVSCVFTLPCVFRHIYLLCLFTTSVSCVFHHSYLLPLFAITVFLPPLFFVLSSRLFTALSVLVKWCSVILITHFQRHESLAGNVWQFASVTSRTQSSRVAEVSIT